MGTLADIPHVNMWDRLYLRLARFIRDMGDPSSRADDLQQRVTAFVPQTGAQVARLDPSREILLIGVGETAFSRFAPTRSPGGNAGISLAESTGPLILTRETHRDLVGCEWFIGSTDSVVLVQTILVVEMVRVR